MGAEKLRNKPCEPTSDLATPAHPPIALQKNTLACLRGRMPQGQRARSRTHLPVFRASLALRPTQPDAGALGAEATPSSEGSVQQRSRSLCDRPPWLDVTKRGARSWPYDAGARGGRGGGRGYAAPHLRPSRVPQPPHQATAITTLPPVGTLHQACS